MAVHEYIIPLESQNTLKLYQNTRAKSINDIYKEQDVTAIINGTLYNMTKFRPVMWFKVDGSLVSTSTDNYYAYVWNTVTDFSMQLVPQELSKYKNCICGCTLITPWHGKLSKLYYDSGVGGSRLRSAIGIKNKSVRFIITNNGYTPENLRDLLFDLGYESAIMLDGGGSTQCIFHNEYTQKSTDNRKVQNLLLAKVKAIDSNPDTSQGGNITMGSLNIIQKPMTNNRTYTSQYKCTKSKLMLHSTGTPGASATAIFNNMNLKSANASVEFIIDDTGVYQCLPIGIRSWHAASTANTTHIACEICEPIETRLLDINWKPISKGNANNTTFAVKRLQMELSARGYDPKGIDGSFGPGCDAALRKFQKDNGLTQDGSCGPATMKVLRKREGSYMLYNANDPEVKAYFADVYDKAVQLYAYLHKTYCKKTPADDIVCHSEGFKLGIASNHADVLHWFPEHGKSMVDFRNDVAACIAGTYKGFLADKTTPEVSDHAKAVQKFVDAGIISSPDYWLKLDANDPSLKLEQLVPNIKALIKKTADTAL